MSNRKSFEIDVKRFYMPGCKLADACAKCGAVVEQDLGDHYLSYPMANEPFARSFYCECGHEWKRMALLAVDVKLLPEAGSAETP